MTRKAVTSSSYSGKDFRKMSMEEKLYLMDELYQRAVEDGTLKRYLQARKKGVEEVANRWKRLKGLA